MEAGFRTWRHTAPESVLSEIEAQRAGRIQSRDDEGYPDTMVACHQVKPKSPLRIHFLSADDTAKVLLVPPDGGVPDMVHL